MFKKLGSEIGRLKNTAGWSLAGAIVAWHEEKSVRQWAALNVIGWIILIVADFSAVEAAVLIAMGTITVVVELLNSAVEVAIDYISTERHPMAKKAKDIASAAVMATGLTWGACWVILSWDKVFV